MAAKANGTARRGVEDRRGGKKRRQLIVIAVGGVVLLGAGRLPGASRAPRLLVGERDGDAATTPPPAVPVATPAGRPSSSSPVPAWIRAISERDVFVPQVVVGAAGASTTAAAAGPNRPRRFGRPDFVVKDPFVPADRDSAAAAAALDACTAAASGHPPISRRSRSAQSGGYIVVLAADLGRRRHERAGGRP